ncbi:hypothetical protein LAZ67_1002398 [Cordylochernes scorpioides]|uniref:CCHC-type domain-containing protein n=1 Tax=Cordylochernes scorpioides TaxID=51811 RepID=A0ABY6JYT5_9ARAC|nr:hypothetical protein LAZ67_1002398 [Cordylochernes scorpioides]
MSSAKITYSIKGGPRKSKPWFDKVCYDIKKLAKESLKKYRKTNRLEDWECYASSRKKYLALLDLKRKGFDNEKQEILRNSKDSKTFWKTFALYKSTSIIQGEIAIQDWLNFYRELMTTEKNLRICNLHNVISQNDPILDSEITNADIYKEIAGLKINKACGPDGIPNEVLKILPDSYILLLKQLYNSVMTTGKYPAIWTNSTLHPIFKNGYKNSPSNYRDLPSVNLPEFGDIHLLLYADDIAIIGESRMNLQKKIKILKEYLDENLMTLNESKSKIMVFRNGENCELTFIIGTWVERAMGVEVLPSYLVWLVKVTQIFDLGGNLRIFRAVYFWTLIFIFTAQDFLTWKMADISFFIKVVFSDESRFCLSSDSRRVRVWRRRGERSNPAGIVERPTVRQRHYDGQRYVDDVLRPVTLPYLQGVPNALYQQDNARPHTARISQQALQDVQMLPWPPYSPDLSPIEHVWDIIGRRLHALPQPRSEDELWQMIARSQLDRSPTENCELTFIIGTWVERAMGVEVLPSYLVWLVKVTQIFDLGGNFKICRAVYFWTLIFIFAAQDFLTWKMADISFVIKCICYFQTIMILSVTIIARFQSTALLDLLENDHFSRKPCKKSFLERNFWIVFLSAIVGYASLIASFNFLFWRKSFYRNVRNVFYVFMHLYWVSLNLMHIFIMARSTSVCREMLPSMDLTTSLKNYLQIKRMDVLCLCKEVDPQMSEEDKISHLMKGIAEELYQALLPRDVQSTEQFITECRRVEALRCRRVTPTKYERLPNVASLCDQDDGEDLSSLIRKIVREEIKQALDSPQEEPKNAVIEDLVREEIVKTLAPRSKPTISPPQASRPRYEAQTIRPHSEPHYRKQGRRCDTNEWRTTEGKPICFYCGRPGHVVRYCRDRKRHNEERRNKYFQRKQDAMEFYNSQTESQEPNDESSRKNFSRYRSPTPYTGRNRQNFSPARRSSWSPRHEN